MRACVGRLRAEGSAREDEKGCREAGTARLHGLTGGLLKPLSSDEHCSGKKVTLDYGKWMQQAHECYRPVPLWDFTSDGPLKGRLHSAKTHRLAPLNHCLCPQ